MKTAMAIFSNQERAVEIGLLSKTKLTAQVTDIYHWVGIYPQRGLASGKK